MSLFDMSKHPHVASGDGSVAWPEWYLARGKTRPPIEAPACHNRRVKEGRHPIGFALGPESETCKTCLHLRYSRSSGGLRGWSKCARVKFTRGAATDTKPGWRACSMWELDT